MGNKLGWILVIVLIAGVVLVAIMTTTFQSRTKPTRATSALGVLDLQESSVSVSRAIGVVPSGPGNAADDFVAACEVWQDHEELLKDVCSGKIRDATYTPPPEAVDALKRIDLLVARAMNKSKMQFVFSKHTTRELMVDFAYKPAAGFEYLGDALGTLVTYHLREGDTDAAIEVLKHYVVLGWHMTQERALLYMVIYGLTLQIEAVNALEDTYTRAGATSRAAGAREYSQSLIEVRRALQEKQAVTWPIEVNKIHPGDIFNIIDNDADPACRVQAVLALAFVKYRSTNRADRAYTLELIDKYVKSDDPLMAAAARAARDWKTASE